LSWVSSHPKNPKTRFLDGALVGVGSFKPIKKREILFLFNQAMNILEG
jgi:hypothetical protein